MDGRVHCRRDVEASSKEYAQEGVDVSHCVRASNSDFVALQSHINKAAAKHVKDYMEASGGGHPRVIPGGHYLRNSIGLDRMLDWSGNHRSGLYS